MNKTTLKKIAISVPALVLMFVFLILPILMTLFYSFTDWNGMSTDYSYVGFDNFVGVLKDSRFPQIMKNTLLYVMIYVPVSNILAFFLALLVFNMRRGANLCKVLIYLPNLLSMVVVGYIWQSMYNYQNGMINNLLRKIGLQSLVQDWLGNPKIVMLSISIAVIWFAVGFYMLIYYAGLCNVPEELYENAEIEGASWFTQQMKITLPLLKGSVITNVILAFIGAWNAFDLPYVMTRGGPLYYSETIALRIYRYAFQETLPGRGMALAIMLSIFVIICSVFCLKGTGGDKPDA